MTLRQRPITNGRISLYLDYYPAVRHPKTFKSTRREFLGIYIYAHPKNEMERDFNEDMLNNAEFIRCRRTQALINEELDIFDQYQLGEDFLAFYKEVCRTKNDRWDIVFGHFAAFCRGRCTFGEITVDFCNKFRDYLLNETLGKKNKRLNQNSAAMYWVAFRSLLKIAYKQKKLKTNVNDYLDSIEEQEVKKNYLTLEELKRLANTPCRHEVLRRASLFSCLTGLRISDIINLKWEDIEEAPEGGYNMRITTIKTRTAATLPISDEAYELCGTPKQRGKVFDGMRRTYAQEPLQEWLRAARITKHITFHCFRHTFATLQLAQDTDIYTVSKMLTHKNVATTQIYADLVNEKKRRSANAISLK